MRQESRHYLRELIRQDIERQKAGILEAERADIERQKAGILEAERALSEFEDLTKATSQLAEVMAPTLNKETLDFRGGGG